MPDNTPNRNYPYPLGTDSPVDVPADIEALATALDVDIDVAMDLLQDKVSVDGDTMTGMLSLPGTPPTSLNHAITKGWADSTYINRTGDGMSGDLDMNLHRVKGVGRPEHDNDAARKIYVDNVFSDAVKKSAEGTQTMQGPLRADAFIITDADEPQGPWHCTPKNYVDAKFGDMSNPMAANLNMGGNYIWNMGEAPAGSPMAATTRDFVNDNYASKAGQNVMTGAMIWGGDWQSIERALRVDANGYYRSTVMDNNASMILNRESGAIANDAEFIAFCISVDQRRGSVAFNDDNTDGVDYNSTCDYRRKEYVGPVTDAADRVKRLARKVYRGRWRSGGAERDFLNAHDLAEVEPQMVHGEKDGPELQTADKTNLVPLLLAALGNALDRIDQLEARLA